MKIVEKLIKKTKTFRNVESDKKGLETDRLHLEMELDRARKAQQENDYLREKVRDISKPLMLLKMTPTEFGHTWKCEIYLDVSLLQECATPKNETAFRETIGRVIADMATAEGEEAAKAGRQNGE